MVRHGRRDRGPALDARQRPLRRARRRPGGRSPAAAPGFDGLAVRGADGRSPSSTCRSRRSARCGRPAATPCAGRRLARPPNPASTGSIRRAGRRPPCCARPATSGVDPGYLSVPEAVSFPSTAPDGAPRTAHALFYPPANPEHEGCPVSCPRCWWSSTAARPSAAVPVLNTGGALLDQPRVRRGRRQLRRLHRLRPGLPGGAVRAVGRGRRGRLPGRRRLAGRARPGGPRPDVHPRWLGRWLHHAGRAGPPGHPVRGRRRPLRGGRPDRAGRRHAQVREPLPGPSGRPVPGGARPLPGALADPARRALRPGR